jgi:flavorubredoxin
MPKVDEIAPDVFRISILEPQFNLQFNHFLIRDEEPLLFHAGYKRMFPELREAVTRLLNPESIRWISFSHFESDECGALESLAGDCPESPGRLQLRRVPWSA